MIAGIQLAVFLLQCYLELSIPWGLAQLVLHMKTTIIEIGSTFKFASISFIIVERFRQ